MNWGFGVGPFWKLEVNLTTKSREKKNRPLPEVLPYTLIEGKTYNLFGESFYTEGYYTRISELTDQLVKLFPDEDTLLMFIRKMGKSKRRFLE